MAEVSQELRQDLIKLLESGDKPGAVKLCRRRGKLSRDDARAFIHGLLSENPALIKKVRQRIAVESLGYLAGVVVVLCVIQFAILPLLAYVSTWLPSKPSKVVYSKVVPQPNPTRANSLPPYRVHVNVRPSGTYTTKHLARVLASRSDDEEKMLLMAEAIRTAHTSGPGDSKGEWSIAFFVDYSAISEWDGTSFVNDAHRATLLGTATRGRLFDPSNVWLMLTPNDVMTKRSESLRRAHQNNRKREQLEREKF